MALLIEKNIEILGDINISQQYLRLIISYGPKGNTIIVNTETFTSKNSYELNRYDNKIRVDGIPVAYSFPYNRTIDTSDILLFAHDKFKEYLSSDVYVKQWTEDPSTLEPIIDPSTGEQEYTMILAKEKYAMDSSISIDI